MLNIHIKIHHSRAFCEAWLNRFDVWIPHNLTEKNRISICDSLYKRNEEIFEVTTYFEVSNDGG